MPCWEINTVTVEFRAKNSETLIKALKNLDYAVSRRNQAVVAFRGTEILFDLKANKIKYSETATSNSEINAIKREYSRLIVEEVAKRKRWLVKQQANGNLQLRRY